MMVHYLGKEIQNELIQFLASPIKNFSESQLSEVLFNYNTLDSMLNVGQMKQMSIIVQFVDTRVTTRDGGKSTEENV